MPKGATHALAWSSSQQAYVLTEGEGLVPLHIVLDSPAWFAWLAQAPSFAFSGKSGSYTARKETRHGEGYWYAYLRTGEKLTKKYLGKTSGLTIARLEDMAGLMQADQAAGGRRSPPAPRVEHETDILSATYPTHAPAGLTPRTPPNQHGDRLTPLLATRLHVPRPRAHLVSRPELIERLQEGIQGPLTLISAPAGFGKTTLLTQWISESGMPVAWLSLEPEDNDPVRFLSYLIAALQTVDGHLGTNAFALLYTPQPPSPETVITLLTNDLVCRADADFILVLDDYHVITDQSLHRALSFLLEHLPPHLHLVLASRADPPLPLSRLRARGQLTEMRVAHLRFSPEEASTFLHTIMGLALPPEHIVALDHRTEGWIAGLQLAALALQGRTDISGFLSGFTGSHRFVLDYLTEEVLSRQPAPVQAFLLHTSILKRLSGPLCDAVTGREGSQATLEALERANLFVVALDDERQWYRYHHLFAEVLRNHLQQAEPNLVPELHRRASAWYEQHELPIEAIQHALVAPDIELAARLIEQLWNLLTMTGQFYTVLGWLDALPDAVIRTRPFLCLQHAILLNIANQMEKGRVRLDEAEKWLQGDMAAEQTRSIMGQIALVRAQLSLFSGDITGAVSGSYRALELLPETDLRARANAVSGTACAYLVSGDVTPATEDIVMTAEAFAPASKSLMTIVRSSTVLAWLYFVQGRLREAATTYERILQMVPRPEVLQGLSVSSLFYFFGLGELHYESNSLDEASRSLAQGMELIRETVTVEPHVATVGYTVLARLQQARGDPSRALATLAAFTQLAHQRHFAPHWIAHVDAVRAQLELAQGNLASALRWADRSDLSANDDDLSYPREREHLTLARVRIAQGRNDSAGNFFQDALGLLARLLEDAEAKARMGSVLEILILRALAFDAQGNRKEALASLERALLLAEPQGYIRLFLDEGGPMVALLRQAYTQGIAPDYVATLLSAFGEQTPAAPSRAFPPVEPLTERERAVFRLLVAGLSNAAMAQELVITVGTVKRHVNSIYTKLGVNSRTQAVARAHALHLL